MSHIEHHKLAQMTVVQHACQTAYICNQQQINWKEKSRGELC